MLLRPFPRFSRRRSTLGVVLIAASLVLAASARAQDHDMAHMDHGMEADTSAKRPMEVATPLGIPMERTGSGTSWLPDAAPLPAVPPRGGGGGFQEAGGG